MARINTNVASLIAQHNLQRSNSELAVRLQRLSTGLRINRGADDPAGLIVSERLRSEVSGITQAIDNTQRASSVIATTEGYLAEVADLLTSVKGLVVEAASTGGISREEIEANQLQIDSAIESITRISNTATFAGLRLLDGSLEYTVSGVAASAVTAVNVHGVQFGSDASRNVAVEVVTSAQTGSLFLSGNTAGAAGELLSSVTLEIAGTLGVQTLSFVSGTNLSAVVAAVNTLRDSTGISASLVDAADQTSGLTFNSTGYGSDQFVSVRAVGEGGDFFETYDARNGAATSRDVDALSINTLALSLELDLTAAYAQTPGTARSFDIVGGGASFQLGPNVTTSQQVGFGVQSVAASRIGGTDIAGIRHYLDSIRTGQSNSLLSGDAQRTAQILDAAINDVSVLRGRLGAFERNTIETTSRSLQIGLENITASESKIRDADFAAETAELTRAQILVQAGTSVLSTANVTARNVLSLLG